MGDPKRLERLRVWRVLVRIVLERSLICVWGDAFVFVSVRRESVSDRAAVVENFMIVFWVG